MIGLKKKSKNDFNESVSRRSTVTTITDSKAGLDFLVSFFSAIRPSPEKGKSNATQNMKTVIYELQEHPVLLGNLQHALLSQLIKTDLSAALTESGIPLARGFWQEFFGRLRHKLLPSLQSENDFLYVLNRVFFRDIKSRGVRLKEYPEFLGILWRYFRKRPLDFIRPRKRLTMEE